MRVLSVHPMHVELYRFSLGTREKYSFRTFRHNILSDAGPQYRLSVGEARVWRSSCSFQLQLVTNLCLWIRNLGETDGALYP